MLNSCSIVAAEPIRSSRVSKRGTTHSGFFTPASSYSSNTTSMMLADVYWLITYTPRPTSCCLEIILNVYSMSLTTLVKKCLLPGLFQDPVCMSGRLLCSCCVIKLTRDPLSHSK